MPDLTPEEIKALAESIAFHATGGTGGTGHLAEFGAGTQQQDLVEKITEMLNDDSTKFIVNNSNDPDRAGSIVFYNEKKQSVLIFNPNQLNDPIIEPDGRVRPAGNGGNPKVQVGPDNLAGTFYRMPKLNEDGVPVNSAGKPIDLEANPDLPREMFERQVENLKKGVADNLNDHPPEPGRQYTADDVNSRGISESTEWADRIDNHTTKINEGLPKAVDRVQSGQYLNQSLGDNISRFIGNNNVTVEVEGNSLAITTPKKGSNYNIEFSEDGKTATVEVTTRNGNKQTLTLSEEGTSNLIDTLKSDEFLANPKYASGITPLDDIISARGADIDTPKPKPSEPMDVVADGGKTPAPTPTTGEKPVLPVQDGNLALDIKPEEFPDQAPDDIDPDIAETNGVKASQAADVVHPQTHIDDLKSVIQTGIEDGINFETNSDGRLTITPANESVNKYEIQLDFENKSGAMRVTKPNGEIDIIKLNQEQLVKMNDMLSGIEVPGPEGGRIPNLEDTAKLYYEANPPKINIESPELRLDGKAGEVIPDAPKVGGIDNAVDATADIARGANTADNLADTMKTVGQAADALKAGKALSKTAKLSIIGGVALTGGVAALLHVAHEGQRGLAGEMKDAGQLSPEAYEAYMDMNTDTEIMMQAENAAAQGWLFLLSTPAVEARATSDFKEWADKYAPNLSEEQYQALSMSMFPGNSARAEMLWDARDQLPSTTEGQPEFIHRAVDLNALYEEAGDIHYSHSQGFVYSGNIAETTAKAQAMGIEVEPSRDPAQAIKNLKEAIKQELVTELDQQFRAPENMEHMLDLVPVDERMEYARRLAGSESDPAQFAKDHPEIAAYVKEYDESWFGWDWTLDNDDPLKANPDLLNDYIMSKTQISPKASAPEVAPEVTPTQVTPIIPSEGDTTSPSTPTGNQQAAVEGKPTPSDVIDRTSEIDRILPPDANFTVQSSDNNASVTRGLVPDEQISLVQDNDKDPATLPEVEQERARQAEFEQQRLAELAQQQANAQMEQQQQPNTPTASR